MTSAKFLNRVKDSLYQTLLVAVAILGTLHFIGSRADKSRAAQVDKDTPLTEGQVRRLVVDMLRDQIIIQDKEKVTKVYTGVRKAVFTELSSGEIEMDIPTRGWTFEPGFTLGTSEGMRLGLDVQWGYWKRWGIVSGITIPPLTRTLENVRLHTGLSYNFHNKFFPSTSVWGGFDTSLDTMFGVRTRF